MEGLAAAAGAGARMIEFDVQLSGDGVPLVVHDDNLRRTAGVDLSITATRAAIVRSVARDTAPVATVSEVGEWLAGQTLTAFVEIKRQSLAAFGAARVIEKLLPALRPALSKCVVISFAAEVLEHARRRLRCPVGWVLRETGPSQRARAVDLDPEYLFVDRLRLPDDGLWPGDWRWAVYTIDDPETALAMAGRGANLVETDDIGAMLAAQPWHGTRGAAGG